MPNRAPPIARVRLARSLRRLLALPALLLLAGAAVAAYGALAVVMPVAVAPLAAGTGLMLVGLTWAAWLLSIRLDVQEAAIRVHWLGGERIYPLVAGPVTRVRFRGETASKLRARMGILGWQLGEARLRNEEEVHVVRLAPTDSAILVPTEKGRLAIAAADESRLLDALTRAARERQRLEELTAPEPPAAPEPVVEPEVPQEPSPPDEAEPQVLTGIERALLEQRLAEERAAAEAAGTQGEPIAEPLAPEAAAPEPMLPAPAPVPAARRRRAITVPRPHVRAGLRRLGARPLLVLLPLVAAAIAWGVGLLTGRMPESGTDLGRLTTLAFVLAGPATSIGAIMALAWWPRIVGVVVAGGLAASAFIGRALLGG